MTDSSRAYASGDRISSPMRTIGKRYIRSKGGKKWRTGVDSERRTPLDP